MSKLGIGLFYFALLGAVAAGICGYLMVQKLTTTQHTLADTQQNLTTTQAKLKKESARADSAEKQRDETAKELTETKSKVEDLNTKLADAQKQADSLNTQLSAAKADADKAKKDLQHVADVLGNMSPEDAKAAMQKAQSDLAAAQSREKILQDQLQASTKEVADLHDAINRSKVGKMPGVTGKITFVNRAWNFVVINVGLTNGVVPNGELIVYRGRNFLGKVKVTSAEDNTAVADILPSAKGDIQVGDDVLN